MKLDRRALLGVLGALAAGRTRAETASGTAGAVPWITDAAGRHVRVPGTVARVFPAGPPAAILLYTLAPDLMLGWTRPPRPAEAAYLLPEAAAKPELGRLTGRGGTANLEVVIAARPDIIVDSGSTGETYVSLAERVEAGTGIPYALLDGALAGTPATYRALGRLLHRERDAEALASAAEAILSRVAARVAGVPPERRPRVYVARGARGLETARGGAINTESLDLVGAVNVAGATRGGLATVSVEAVLAWDPDAIVATDPAFRETMRADPAWGSLRAVREGRVHVAPALPFGWFDAPPSVNRLIGLPWLGRALYPDLFPEDLTAQVRAFHARFYHVELGDAGVAALLDGRA